MNFTKKLFMTAGALLFAAILTSILTPKTTQALVAALVQITNTTSNPAITEDVSKSASQAVNLTCAYDGNAQPVCRIYGTDLQYVVPAGKSLLVTTVDINPAGGVSEYVALAYVSGNNAVQPAQYTAISGFGHYAYPSGLVFPSGVSPYFSATAQSTSVNLYGYLTSN